MDTWSVILKRNKTNRDTKIRHIEVKVYFGICFICNYNLNITYMTHIHCLLSYTIFIKIDMWYVDYFQVIGLIFLENVELFRLLG